MNKFISALLLFLSVTLVTSPVMASSASQVVRPGQMYSWAFIDDQTGGAGSGTMVTGPATPPLGTGSANFTLVSSTDGQILASAKYNGIDLSRMTNLVYSTYQNPSNPSNATAISLQFAVDKNEGPPQEGYQGRMVYEPYVNNGGVVPLGVWTQWDTINGGAGKWWFTRSTQSFGGNCPQSNPCTWNQILTLYPNMRVHPTLGAVVLKAGSNWNGFNGNTDALTIGLDGNDLTFDFEPASFLK